MKNKNILLVDYGNTCLKTWVVNLTTNAVVMKQTFNAKTPFVSFLNEMKKVQFCTSIWSCSNQQKYAKIFVKAFLKKFIITKNIILTQEMLMKKVSINKKARKQVIGIDILLLLYYYAHKNKSCLVLSLGTVYFALVIIKRSLENVLFIPNLTFGLASIPKLTSIPSKDIPIMYDQTIGLNTKHCFAAGCYHAINGFITSILKLYPKKLKVFLIGGDAYKYPALIKKHCFDENAMLKALLLFYQNNY